MMDLVQPGQSIELSSVTEDKLPLYSALHKAFDENHSGVLTVAHDDTRTAVTVIQGRAVSVIHESTSAASVMNLLERSGLIAERDVLRAERESRKKGIFLEDAILSRGLVSEGTLSSTREKLCLEVLIDLIIRPDIGVTAVWSVRRGTREMCSLPIPFLLRESQRRRTHLPTIERAVPSTSLVFAKASSLSGKPGDERWEDLQLSVAERQVYFFVDGKRTVSEVALATCQSEYNVSQSVQALVEMGLLKSVKEETPESAGSLAFRAAVLRLASLGLAIVLLLGLTAFSLHLRLNDDDGTQRLMQSDPYNDVLKSGPTNRLKGAIRLYEMTYGEPPDSFDTLFREHFVLREDRKAAATFPMGEGFLLKSQEAPEAPPSKPE